MRERHTSASVAHGPVLGRAVVPDSDNVLQLTLKIGEVEVAEGSRSGVVELVKWHLTIQVAWLGLSHSESLEDSEASIDSYSR